MRPYLISAISGGQWTQARVASVRDWADDTSCQLCGAEYGTLLHRHECPATMPSGGWQSPPENVQQFFDKLDPKRRLLLTTRGLLA
eukprot:6539804-Karenia_brevis.AAC.1